MLLLQQFQHIKVSLFLQDGIQSPDGTIVLPQAGPLVNDDTVEAPGTIRLEPPSKNCVSLFVNRYYNEAGDVTGTDTFPYLLMDSVGPRLTGDPYDKNTRDSKLGKNMYATAASA